MTYTTYIQAVRLRLIESEENKIEAKEIQRKIETKSQKKVEEIILY